MSFIDSGNRNVKNYVKNEIFSKKFVLLLLTSISLSTDLSRQLSKLNINYPVGFIIQQQEKDGNKPSIYPGVLKKNGKPISSKNKLIKKIYKLINQKFNSSQKLKAKDFLYNKNKNLLRANTISNSLNSLLLPIFLYKKNTSFIEKIYIIWILSGNLLYNLTNTNEGYIDNVKIGEYSTLVHLILELFLLLSLRAISKDRNRITGKVLIQMMTFIIVNLKFQTKEVLGMLLATLLASFTDGLLAYYTIKMYKKKKITSKLILSLGLNHAFALVREASLIIGYFYKKSNLESNVSILFNYSILLYNISCICFFTKGILNK